MLLRRKQARCFVDEAEVEAEVIAWLSESRAGPRAAPRRPSIPTDYIGCPSCRSCKARPHLRKPCGMLLKCLFRPCGIHLWVANQIPAALLLSANCLRGGAALNWVRVRLPIAQHGRNSRNAFISRGLPYRKTLQDDLTGRPKESYPRNFVDIKAFQVDACFNWWVLRQEKVLFLA